ncbi:MAG: hypothetical protein ACLQU6_03985 [Limisphaerales bacterium]
MITPMPKTSYQPSTMNSQPILFLVQIKEIVDFEEELAGAKN